MREEQRQNGAAFDEDFFSNTLSVPQRASESKGDIWVDEGRGINLLVGGMRDERLSGDWAVMLDLTSIGSEYYSALPMLASGEQKALPRFEAIDHRRKVLLLEIVSSPATLQHESNRKERWKRCVDGHGVQMEGARVVIEPDKSVNPSELLRRKPDAERTRAYNIGGWS